MDDSDEESESVSEESFDEAGELMANCQYLAINLSFMNLSDKNV